MDDTAKIAKIDHALRTERDRLRGRPPLGEEAVTIDLPTANVLNNYLQTATAESKLRLYAILTGDAS